MKTPELLVPAGTLKNLHYAVAYGADAVYAGLPRYSLRVRNNDFHRPENLSRGIDAAHQAGRKFYLAANVFPHNNKVKTFVADMQPIVEMDPDALIMADPGLIMLVRDRWPDMDVHLSVQANTMNHASVRFWEKQGIKRIILSRELSVSQIDEIRNECPDTELEVFVHGALCMAYSGRCLLSGYFNHRDANQGACTNSCRWDYKLKNAVEDHSGDIRPATKVEQTVQSVFLLEENQRPGEYMPVEEDEHGTYIMNSKDLRAVEHVARLVEIGVDSLKIEGRTKSHYYVARTTQVYKQAIDDAAAGKPFNRQLLGALDNLSNRGYTSGFLDRHHDQEYQNYLDGRSLNDKQIFVGEIDGYDEATGMMSVEAKNKFTVGDDLELLLPKGNRHFRLETILDINGDAMHEVPGGGYRVQIPIKGSDFSMGLLTRYLQ